MTSETYLWTGLSGCVIFLLYRIYKKVRLSQLSGSYFTDKTVLITGASSGLGKALVEEMYELGAQVIMCARNVQELERIKEHLIKTKSGNKKYPEVLGLDVSDSFEKIKPRIDAILNKFKRIDVLVNNAGISYRGESYNATDEVYQQILEVNFFGPVRLTNMVVNHMIEDNKENDRLNRSRRAYSIVNIGSVQSYIGTPYRGPYCASKAALQAYSDSVRAELFAHKNITVSTVNPGYVNTSVSVNALRANGQKNNQNDALHEEGYSPQYVSWAIINAIIEKKNEVLVAVLFHKMGIWVRFFWPELFFWSMYLRAKRILQNNFQD